MKSFKLYLSFLCLLGVLSCNNNQIFLHSFNENNWDYRDSVMFFFNIDNTSKPYNLSLFFRNTLDYSYRNIYFFVEISYGDNVFLYDTLQYSITNKYGQWLGGGMGYKKDNYFDFKENVIFQNKGQYRFAIKHGMREDQLMGTSEVGFKIQTND